MKVLKIVLFVLVLIFSVGMVIFNMPGDISVSDHQESQLPEISIASHVVEVHFLKTAYITVPEAFTIAQGSLFKEFAMVHGAILIEHGNESFLFDTGFKLSYKCLLKPIYEDIIIFKHKKKN